MPLDGFERERIGPERGYRWQLWEHLGLPLHAYANGCDLLHSPANTTPPRCPMPRIVTLHDAMPFHDWNTDGQSTAIFSTHAAAGSRGRRRDHHRLPLLEAGHLQDS